MYVDNVILTADPEKEGVRKSRESKGLFKDMNINLREFQANNERSNAEIPHEDRSTNKKPKVLGIVWDSE